MDELYLDIVDNSIKKLLQQIVIDYGNQYNFNIDTLINYYDTLNINLKLSKQLPCKITNKKEKHKKHKNIKSDIEQVCQARVWGNGYINCKHYRKYIHNSEKLDPTKIGKKCTRSCINSGIYCLQHAIKNTHGNFYLMPPKDKMGEYINNNKHKIY